MNIPECRQFVINHPPNCCGRVVTSGYYATKKIQYFSCISCKKEFNVCYWPLYESDIREMKLNKLVI
jgi:hypothetical protein